MPSTRLLIERCSSLKVWSKEIQAAFNHSSHNGSTYFKESKNQLQPDCGSKIDMSKMRVMLIGDEFAQNRLLPYLDMFYRDPKSPPRKSRRCSRRDL